MHQTLEEIFGLQKGCKQTSHGEVTGIYEVNQTFPLPSEERFLIHTKE